MPETVIASLRTALVSVREKFSNTAAFSQVWDTIMSGLINRPCLVIAYFSLGGFRAFQANFFTFKTADDRDRLNSLLRKARSIVIGLRNNVSFSMEVDTRFAGDIFRASAILQLNCNRLARCHDQGRSATISDIYQLN